MHTIHVGLGKMLQNMQCRDSVKPPNRGNIISEQINVCKLYLFQLLLISNSSHGRKGFSLNINANHFGKEGKALSDEQGEESKGTTGVEKALSHTQSKNALIHRRKCP